MTAKTGNPIGRPRKKKLPVGRPKGEAAIMKDYRMSMLNSPKSPKVLKRIMDAALDDDHKHQAVAWKLVVDRIAPLATFHDGQNSGSNKIEINISGMSNPIVSTESAIDAEYDELHEDKCGVDK